MMFIDNHINISVSSNKVNINNPTNRRTIIAAVAITTKVVAMAMLILMKTTEFRPTITKSKHDSRSHNKNNRNIRITTTLMLATEVITQEYNINKKQ